MIVQAGLSAANVGADAACRAKHASAWPGAVLRQLQSQVGPTEQYEHRLDVPPICRDTSSAQACEQDGPAQVPSSPARPACLTIRPHRS
jgi:hypothetical protein